MELLVFADTNLFLDAFLSRKPNDGECVNILGLAYNKKIQIYTSPSCLLNVMYFLKKDGMSKQDVITIISRLLDFISLVSAVEQTFKAGLFSDFNDLGDAVQYHTALQIKGIDYFITANIKDYKKSTAQLPVVSPGQFWSKYKLKTNK